MKIALLNAYSGRVSRGAETFVHEIANGLSHLGHEVTVYQSGPKISDADYSTIQINAANSKGGKLPFLGGRSRSIKKFTSDALSELETDTDIVIPTNGQWQTLLVKFWCLKHGAKMVVSGQSGPGFDDRVNVLCFPDQFVALSKAALKKARGDNPFVQSIFIPNGVDLQKYNPIGNKFKIKLKGPIVLCVGALVPEKQIDLVIKAVSATKNLSLLMVGTGPLERELTALASELLPQRHQFISVDHSLMPEVYRIGDVFTLVPRKSESFGIVYVEALASNLPVVTIDDETRHDIVGKAGDYISDPTDKIKYGSMLQAVVEKKWGVLPRKTATKFDWSDISKQYEAIFTKILKK